MADDKKQELAITVKKEEDIGAWYTQVIQKADLIEYTDVSGCMVFKPNSYQIWEKIQDFLNEKIKKSGVKNAYFPMFIPEKLLCREQEHVEGFTPEVAWVTHAGETKLSEKLAIRPTSETIMYDSYAKWIHSYRDLPLRLNQWCNVVRWEFKTPTPFLRNREFLWQEGHSVFATKKEADKEVLEILNYYGQLYEDLLAIPVNKGRKSVGEKFAGADYTTTVETLLVDGKAIQGGTSHALGQNFAKAFDIKFTDENQKVQLPYQNSWGVSTRIIGAMIMVHSDNKGFVVPPRVAVQKGVIVPLLFKGKEEIALAKAKELLKMLGKDFFVDARSEVSPGFKFSEWEQKGIPLRIEIGPRDIENNQVVLVRRDTSEKKFIKIDELKKTVKLELEAMHQNLYDRAKKVLEERTVEVKTFDEFQKAILEKKRCLVAWAESKESEDEIKEKTGAKSSCIPFNINKERKIKGEVCFYSGKPATCWAYFCKSH